MRRQGCTLVLGLALIAVAPPLWAAEHYAFIVTGASGGVEYGQKFGAWRASLVATLRDQFGYPADHVVVLSEDGEPGRRATRDDVRAALERLSRRLKAEDLLFVLLIGHGSAFYGEPAKFNLVGPDLAADEWADLLEPISARLVFVNSTGSSFPFLDRIARPGWIVLTATDTEAQRYDTVFPEFFVAAFKDLAADLDKNGKVSVWEAFDFASAGVKGWFETRGRLATERPLLDDTGTGAGVEAGSAGTGALARVTYLQPDVPPAVGGNLELANLYRRRAEVEVQLGQLKAGRGQLPPDEYNRQLEALLLELARLDRQIRTKP